MNRLTTLQITPLVLLVVVAGCSHHRLPWLASVPVSGALENPLFVPETDREFLWNQVVDTVDNYFRIQREDRVRLVGNVLTEGRIYTYPRSGSTLLEPWHRDSSHGYEKLSATLQSIRRRAEVRVMPAEAGYYVEVVVLKELEDVDRPEHASVGAATLRHDGTIVRTPLSPASGPVTLGWIPQGRDHLLEQKILSEIRSRASNLGPLPPIE